MELSTVHSKDNDQVSVRGVFTSEANEELENFRSNSNQNYINFGCSPLRDISSDICQATFALTRILPSMNNITKNIVFK